MKRLLVTWLSALSLPAADAPVLRGYTASSAAAQREWETKFRTLPIASEVGAFVKRMSARPHHVGSAYDRDSAQWILAKFREWGLTAEIETVNAIRLVPVSPSDRDASAIDTTGTGSSSTMVPDAVATPSVAFTGFDSVSEKVSLFSYSVSPTTGTVTVALVDPAGIVAEPVDVV